MDFVVINNFWETSIENIIEQYDYLSDTTLIKRTKNKKQNFYYGFLIKEHKDKIFMEGVYIVKIPKRDYKINNIELHKTLYEKGLAPELKNIIKQNNDYYIVLEYCLIPDMNNIHLKDTDYKSLKNLFETLINDKIINHSTLAYRVKKNKREWFFLEYFEVEIELSNEAVEEYYIKSLENSAFNAEEIFE